MTVQGKVRRLCSTTLQFCDHLHVWHHGASQALSAVAQARSQDAGLFSRAVAQLLTEAVELCSVVNCPNRDAVSIVEEVGIQLHALCTEMSHTDTVGYYTLLLAMKQAPQIILAILKKQSDLWNTVKGSNEGAISNIFRQISNCRQHLAIANSVWIAKELLYQERIYAVKSSNIINAFNDELWQLWHAATRQQVIVEQQHNFILQDLQSVLSSCLGVHRYKAKLTPFGSRISGLAGPESDLDVSLSLIKRPSNGSGSNANVSEEYERIIFDNKRGVDYGNKGTNTSSFILRLIRQYVNRDRRFYCLDVIQWARIPIIKLKHRTTNVEVDVCLENQMGVQNTYMLRNFVASDFRIHCLLLSVKHWAKQRCVNQSNNGTISTFSWCLLVLYYLHNVCSPPVAASFVISEAGQQFLANCGEDYASLHSEVAMFQLIKDENVLRNDDRSVGELFLGFFAFYGGGHATECFDYGREAVNLRYLNGRCFVNTVDIAADEEDEEQGRNVDDHEAAEEDDNIAPTGNGKAGVTVPFPTEEARGRRKASLWSIKITDPFLDWDLGRVVRSEEAMSFIVGELHRGMYLLSERLSHPSIDTHQVWEELCQRHPDLPNGFCICPRCSQLGHIENYCPQCKCSKCGRNGHRKFVCTAKQCSICRSFEHAVEACTRSLALTRALPDVPAASAFPPTSPSLRDFPALQRVSSQNQRVAKVKSESPRPQLEDYAQKKKEVTAIMRDFTTKKVRFFAKDGSTVLQQQYQEIKSRMVEGDDIANYLRGTTLRFVARVDKKKQKAAEEVKLFVPMHEAISVKGPNTNNGIVNSRSTAHRTTGEVSNSKASPRDNQDRSLQPAVVDTAKQAIARLSISPRPQDFASHPEPDRAKAPYPVWVPQKARRDFTTRPGSMSVDRNVLRGPEKPNTTNQGMKEGASTTAAADVQIVSPLPLSPVAEPQQSTKSAEMSNKPQKENRRRARRREYAQGRREETASAAKQKNGDVKVLVPKDG